MYIIHMVGLVLVGLTLPGQQFAQAATTGDSSSETEAPLGAADSPRCLSPSQLWRKDGDRWYCPHHAIHHSMGLLCDFPSSFFWEIWTKYGIKTRYLYIDIIGIIILYEDRIKI